MSKNEAFGLVSGPQTDKKKVFKWYVPISLYSTRWCESFCVLRPSNWPYKTTRSCLDLRYVHTKEQEEEDANVLSDSRRRQRTTKREREKLEGQKKVWKPKAKQTYQWSRACWACFAQFWKSPLDDKFPTACRQWQTRKWNFPTD